MFKDTHLKMVKVKNFNFMLTLSIHVNCVNNYMRNT